MATPGILRAITSFFADGHAVAQGALVREGHAITKGREAFFEKLKLDFDYDVKAADAGAEKVEAELASAAKADAPKVEAQAVKAVTAAVKGAEGKAAS